VKLWFWRRKQQQEQLDQEIQSHLQMAAGDRVERGESRTQAEQRARREFGNVGLVQEVTRDQWGWRFLHELYGDLRFGFRTLGKNPGFAAVVVLTLALGIGANSAIFSLIDAALLRSLPVRDADRVVLVEWRAHKNPAHWSTSSYGDCEYFNEGSLPGGCSLSQPFFNQIRQQAALFSGVAAFAGADRIDITSDSGADTIEHAEYISGEYFATLGVQPALGRLIGVADDVPSAPAVTVLSHGYWLSKFAGSPSVIGKSVLLNKVPCTIVGVAEQRFDVFSPGNPTQMWIPLAVQPQLEQPWDNREVDAQNWWLGVVARLNPEISRLQAQAALSTIFNREMISGQQPMFKAEDDPAISLVPVEQGLTGNRTDISKPLYVLLLAVGIVLLIACANVAGLLLSRASARQQEMAVRFALGASPLRILRQLLTESLLLAAVGGALGILFASWCVHSISAFIASSEDGPSTFTPGIDTRVMVFTAGISILTAILFGLAPTLRGLRVELAPTLKEGTRSGFQVGGTAGKQWFTAGNALVVVQVALSIVVLAGAGLLVRTLQNLKTANPGFDTRHILTFSLDPTLIGYKSADTAILYRELQGRFASMPGIRSVSYSWRPLLAGSLWTTDFHLPGKPKDDRVGADMLPVGEEFFHTMGIPMLSGREFNAADVQRAEKAAAARALQQEEFAARLKNTAGSQSKSTPASNVAPVPAIVNDAFVRRYLSSDPIGQQFGASPGNPEIREPQNPGWMIVGVVANAKYNDLRRDAQPTIYVPHSGGMVSFVLRGVGEVAVSAAQIRSIVAQIDRNLPVYNIKTEQEHIDRKIFKERLIARLSGFFGVLALLLACVGLYGLISYEVARRTREIGIRTALGADKRDVLGLVLLQGMRLVMVGAVIGIALALALMRYAASLLYGVRATDPTTFVAVTSLLAGVTLAACYVPARRATAVDPVVALRYE
jgi:predicted permease